MGRYKEAKSCTYGEDGIDQKFNAPSSMLLIVQNHVCSMKIGISKIGISIEAIKIENILMNKPIHFHFFLPHSPPHFSALIFPWLLFPLICLMRLISPIISKFWEFCFFSKFYSMPPRETKALKLLAQRS